MDGTTLKKVIMRNDVKPWTDVRDVRIQFVGDSNTEGSGAGNSGAFRTSLYERLRSWRGDFNFIGSKISVPEELGSFGMWYHDGYSGQTIPGINTLYPTIVANIGANSVDVVVDMLGTNDIAVSGSSAATMTFQRSLLNATYRANQFSTHIVQVAPPPFVAGTTVGGNAAAWNAIRATYVASLVNQPHNGVFVFDPVASLGLGVGDMQLDGIHLNQFGYGRLGMGLAKFIDTEVIGPRQQSPLPRNFNQRQPAYAVLCPLQADSFSVANHPGFNPGSASFALAFDYLPGALSAAYTCVAQYGNFGAPPEEYALFQRTGHLDFFWRSNAGTGLFVNQPNGRAMQALKWHRIVVMAHRPSGTIGMYINGCLVGLVSGIAAWTFTQQTMFFGSNTITTFGEPASYYSRIATFQGDALVPRPGTNDALRAVEDDYYLGDTLVGGAGGALYTLNNTLASGIFGGPVMVLAGTSALTAPDPTGTTPRRPWEFTQPYLAAGVQ